MEGVKQQDMEQAARELVETMRREKAVKGLTNNELAEESGVSVYTLNKLLAGSVGNPGIIQAASVCKVLGVSLDAAMGLPVPEAGEAGELAAELEATKRELARLEERSELQQAGIADRNKMVEDTRNAWKPLAYGLLGLCILCMAMLMVYVARDLAVRDQGYIRGGVLPWWITAAAMAGVGIVLFCAHWWAKRRRKK